jgi:hypothetical protein
MSIAIGYKRLERGQFKLPHMDPSTMAVEIDATQLAMLLDGIDFGRVRRPEHWHSRSATVARIARSSAANDVGIRAARARARRASSRFASTASICVRRKPI